MSQKKKRGVKKKKSNRVNSKFCLIGIILVSIIMIVSFLIYFLNSIGPGEVFFSHESGIYSESINIELGKNGLLAIQPVEIRYNLDGDSIYDSNEKYISDIELEVPDSGYRVYTITAAACKQEECLTPTTKTYILGKNLNSDLTNTVININSSKQNLYDYRTGIMVKGSTYDHNEYMGIGQDYINGNYNNRGDDWMRDAYITIFNTDGKVMYDGGAIFGISGGSSAAFDVKSLKIELLSEDYSYDKEFRLRSGGQDQFSGNIRSSVASRLVDQSGFDVGTSTERVAVFLNGDFYGIFDKQLNYSKSNLVLKFGLANKNCIEKYKNNEIDVFRNFQIDRNTWQNLDLAENREKLESIIDMDNYLNYYAIQILLNNTDWPMNNFEAWRCKKKPSNNKYEDGRIRFLIYDTDLIYYKEGNDSFFDGSISDNFENLMEWKYNGTASSFRSVVSSEYYRERFIEILRNLINGPFSTDNILKIVDDETNKIEHQMKLFYTAEEYDEWKVWIELMKEAIVERDAIIRDDVKKYFDVTL